MSSRFVASDSKATTLPLVAIDGRPVRLAEEIGTDRAHNMIQRLVEECARGELKVVIDKTFPLAQSARALAHMKSNAHLGKIVLEV